MRQTTLQFKPFSLPGSHASHARRARRARRAKRATTEAQECYFMNLPREMRDEIYKYCFYEPEGYKLSLSSSSKFSGSYPKLVTSAGASIDLSLRLTNRCIAAETRGLPLMLNTIHFYPFNTPSFNYENGVFGTAIEFVQHRAEHIVMAHCPDMSDEILDRLTRDYPQYRKTLQAILEYDTQASLFEDHKHEAISTQRKFVAHALSVLLAQPGFREALELPPTGGFLEHLPLQGFELWGIQSLPVWTFQTSAASLSMSHILNILGHVRTEDVVDDCKTYLISAAAMAAHFLECTSRENRKDIRAIRLEESRQSVAYPECHVQGLIRYCQEHPKLRVHRRVSVWDNIYAAAVSVVVRDHRGEMLEPGGGEELQVVRPALDAIKTSLVTPLVWPWIAEVLALPASGMPPNSFTFEFNCDERPEAVRKLFGAMQEDAAWSVARQQAYQRNLSSGIASITSPSRPHPWADPELLFRTLRDMSAGTSAIQCNFHLRPPVEPSSLFSGTGALSTEKASEYHESRMEIRGQVEERIRLQEERT